jgi:L-fuculose-phosphate aldolase
MGFAVGSAKFDSRLIPESYICLKDIVRYKFGTIENAPDTIVKNISMKNPIAIVENDAVIVAGSTALNAYDRLEVMEFGAFSIRQIKLRGGQVVKISDAEIRDIEQAFNL